MNAVLSAPARPLSRALLRIAPYFGPHRPRLLLIALLAVSTASAAAFEPLVLKALFDSFSAGGPLAHSFLPLALLIVLAVAGESIAAVLERHVWRVRLAVDFALLQDTVERLHALPLAYHRDESVGALMTKIERGIAGCMNAFSQTIVQLVPALVYLSVSGVVMWSLQWRLTLVVLLFAPLPALLGAWASREQMSRDHSLMARWTRIFARFNEVLRESWWSRASWPRSASACASSATSKPRIDSCCAE